MLEYVLVGVSLFIAGGLTWFLVRAWRRYETKLEQQRLQFEQIVRQTKEQIAQLPLEAVQALAWEVLRSEWVLECEEADTSLPAELTYFPPTFRNLAARYKRIVFVGGAELDLWGIQPSQWRSGCYRIGQSDEDATIELVICPDTETVYEIYLFDSDALGRPKVESYPTIYHWIVVENKVMSDLPA
ncbi:MAG: hypothetical protein KatS3mg023_0680 [Armatimonadota bacterium]|nr:MAG: hypothetical protein KatS3mg023_0680 [Armatimonadota bacterium]